MGRREQWRYVHTCLHRENEEVYTCVYVSVVLFTPSNCIGHTEHSCCKDFDVRNHIDSELLCVDKESVKTI